MKYYLIAGEASGDLHASSLMKALITEDENADFRFFGGDSMKSAGGTLVKHYREMAYMGFIPVLLNLRTIMQNLEFCRKDIRLYCPDVVILIDYPGFNLKIAKFIKNELKIPVCYYISPKVWAWKMYRIKSLRRYVDRMFCILPFEKAFFKKHNYHVDYVGNPSADSVTAFLESGNTKKNIAEPDKLKNKPVMAILAGSRKDEVKKNLPVMLSAADKFSQYKKVVAGAPGLFSSDYEQYIDAEYEVEIKYGQTYSLLEYADVALVTSGTATLEAALFRVPQIVCYYVRGGRLSNLIFKNFFHVPYISLVNLIAGKEVVKEMFGYKFKKELIYEELKRIIEDETYKSNMIKGYERVISILGKPGASHRTAQLIIKFLQEKIAD